MLTSIGCAGEVEEKASLVGRARGVERVLQISEQLVLDAADCRKQRAALQLDRCDVRRLDGSSRLRQLHNWSTHWRCLRALCQRHHLADASMPPPQATRSRRRLSLWPEVERLAQQGQQHQHGRC